MFPDGGHYGGIAVKWRRGGNLLILYEIKVKIGEMGGAEVLILGAVYPLFRPLLPDFCSESLFRPKKSSNFAHLI